MSGVYHIVACCDRAPYRNPMALDDHSVFWETEVQPRVDLIEELAYRDWSHRKIEEVKEADPMAYFSRPTTWTSPAAHDRRAREVASLEALGEKHGFRVEHPQEQMSREGHEHDRAYRIERVRAVDSQGREHAVLCSRCLILTTWNVDAICDRCLDKMPEAPEWTL
jgi:hypothetical protein